MSELIPVTIAYRDGAYRVSAPNWDGGEVYPRLEVDVTIASLTARVAGLEQICRDYLGGMEMAQNSAKRRGEKIADLTAQLSAMTQERDKVEKRLMDCQYSLTEVTAKLTAATQHQIESDARITKQRTEITRLAKEEAFQRGSVGFYCDKYRTAETALTEMTTDRDRQYERNGEIALLRMNLETAETALRDARAALKRVSEAYCYCIHRPNAENCYRTIAKAALSAAPQTEPPQAPEKCPKCGGDGGQQHFTSSGDAWIPCPACHGTGWKVQNG